MSGASREQGVNVRKFSLMVVVAVAGCAASSSEPSEAPDVDVNPKIRPLVTNGTVDGLAHPGVVLLRMDTVDGPWRCSGTLIAPTFVVTAGHCTDEEGIVTGI